MRYFEPMSILRDFLRRQAEGKALAPHRFFRDDSNLSWYTPGQEPNRKRGLISQRNARHHSQAYGGSEAMDWVMDCVNLYAETISTAPYVLERKGKVTALKRADDNEALPLADQRLAKLLEKPNPHMEYMELMELLVIDLLLVGNSYWYKYLPDGEGKPFQIWRLAPSDVKIEPGDQGVDHYEYSPSGTNNKLVIDPKNVIQIRRANPHNPYYGMGIIQGAGRAADIDIALTDTQAHYYENRAAPSLVVQSERRVPRDVFRKLRAQLRARTQGTGNAGELLVLEAGLKAETLSASAHDAMFDKLTTTSRDRILAWFRVNPKLLGIAEVGTAGDKVGDARREFDNKVMRPFIDKLQRKITLGLVGLWEDYEFKIPYKYIMPPEDSVKLSGELGGVPGIKVLEIREFMVDAGIIREASTGDKDIDETVLNLPGEELDANGQGGFADRNLPGEPGRPPKGENTRAFPRGTSARTPSTKAVRTRKLTFDEIADRLGDLGHKAVIKREDVDTANTFNKLPNEKRPADVTISSRTRDIDGAVVSMEKDILSAVHVLERGLLDHVEGKAFNPDTLVKRIKNSESWKAFQSMLTRTLTDGTTRAASASAVHNSLQGFALETDLDYDAIVASVINREDGGVRSITANLRDEITQKVAKIVGEGGDRTAVEASVRESVDFWRQHKAETVALTEAVEAYNETSLTIAEELDHAEVFVTDGDDHDEPCVEANGSVWPIDHARKHRTEHPRCRRAFLLLDEAA